MDEKHKTLKDVNINSFLGMAELYLFFLVLRIPSRASYTIPSHHQHKPQQRQVNLWCHILCVFLSCASAPIVGCRGAIQVLHPPSLPPLFYPSLYKPKYLALDTLINLLPLFLDNSSTPSCFEIAWKIARTTE